MDIRQAFVMALKSLLARKMRSLLTMLGIIIGVAAVIAIMTIGRGTLASVEEQFEHLGANMITVNIYNRDSTRQISVEDMYELVSDNAELLCDLSPSVNLGGGIKYGNARYGRTAIAGVSEAYPQTQLLDLAEGDFLQYMDVERRNRVCVVGSYVAGEIMDGRALGGTLKIRGQNYTVIGVLAPYDELSAQNGEGGADDIIYIPYSNVLQLGETPFVGSYTLNSQTRDCSEAAVAAIEARLLACYESEDYFNVTSQKARMAMMLDMQNSMLSVLTAIAGIALLVGGVGIMNIMSVAVSERTKEIGAIFACNSSLKPAAPALWAVCWACCWGCWPVLSPAGLCSCLLSRFSIRCCFPLAFPWGWGLSSAFCRPIGRRGWSRLTRCAMIRICD